MKNLRATFYKRKAKKLEMRTIDNIAFFLRKRPTKLDLDFAWESIWEGLFSNKVFYLDFVRGFKEKNR